MGCSGCVEGMAQSGFYCIMRVIGSMLMEKVVDHCFSGSNANRKINQNQKNKSEFSMNIFQSILLHLKLRPLTLHKNKINFLVSKVFSSKKVRFIVQR
jgi:hypothetical protein